METMKKIEACAINSSKLKSMSMATIYPRKTNNKPRSAQRNAAPNLKNLVPNEVNCSDSSGGSMCKSAICVHFNDDELLKE
jgi:hypothetical protein